MKRILIVSLVTAVSMFFTGCNSLVSSLKGNDFQEFSRDLLNNQDGASGENGLPDYDSTKKVDFSALPGTPAFKIKDGHSDDSEDIESFEVETLLEEDTFLYAYTTKIGERPMVNGKYDESNDKRDVVHCAAVYNYSSGEFLAFHENTFQRTDENMESLYLQQLKNSDGTNGDIFVYDNGYGYIYNSKAELQYQLKIEEDARRFFTKPFAVAVNNAITDGKRRVYVELTLEKTEIVEPEEGEESAEEEELDNQTQEVILVYESNDFSSSIDQTNLNFNKQVEEWQKMTQDEVYTSDEEPDAEADWSTVKENYPDQWGSPFFYHLDKWDLLSLMAVELDSDEIDGTPAFLWTDNTKFGTWGLMPYVCNFKVDYNTVEGYKDLTGNTALTDCYIVKDGRFYQAFGNVGSLGNTDTPSDTADYYLETITREYTYQWTETVTEGETTKEETKTEQKSQSMDVYKKRDASISKGYLEGYWTLQPGLLTSVIGTVNGNVLCMNADNDLYQYSDSKDLSEGLAINSDAIVNMKQEGNNVYLVITLEDQNAIMRCNSEDMKKPSDSDEEWGWTCESISYIENSQMSSALKPSGEDGGGVSQSYLDAHRKQEERELGENANSENGEVLNSNVVLFVEMDPQDEKIALLAEAGLFQKDLYNLIFAGPGGYLITSRTNGLLYFDHATGGCFCLEEGTWYGAWKQGDKIVAVGFEDDGNTYSTLDSAFARVVEFDANEWYSDALDEIIYAYTGKITSDMQAKLDAEKARQEKEKEETLSEKEKKELEEKQELLDDWDETKPDTSTVDLVKPEEDDDTMVDAWGEQEPGSVANQGTTEWGKETFDKLLPALPEAVWRSVEERYSYGTGLKKSCETLSEATVKGYVQTLKSSGYTKDMDEFSNEIDGEYTYCFTAKNQAGTMGIQIWLSKSEEDSTLFTEITATLYSK